MGLSARRESRGIEDGWERAHDMVIVPVRALSGCLDDHLTAAVRPRSGTISVGHRAAVAYRARRALGPELSQWARVG